MQKVDLDFLRKKWKNDIKYYWEEIQKEINDYFEMIKITTRYKAQEKFTKSREDILNDFSLNDEKLKDPLFLPEIMDLLFDIKENNFNLFSSDWISNGYKHYDHAFNIKNRLIPGISELVQEILNFKIAQFNSLYDKPELITTDKKFIDKDFEKFGLKQYGYHLDLINSIAFHEKFYVILPILLRTLFENIIHDIFKISIKEKHRLLYFDKSKNRVADFSVLIELLNQLSQHEYKSAIRANITTKVIEILNDVKEKGNLTVHEVIRKIEISYANDVQDRIDLALEALLVSYNQLSKEKKIEFNSERIKKIEDKLGLRKPYKIKKEKEPKSQIQDLNISELKNYHFLVRLIYLLQKYEEIKYYEREEFETINEIGQLIKKLKIIRFQKKKTSVQLLFTILSSSDKQIDWYKLEMRNDKYSFIFNYNPKKTRFLIRSLNSKVSYKSKAYKKAGEIIILTNFINYLKKRMTQLNLYPLIEEIEKKTKAMKNFFKIFKFLEYIFSPEYLDPELTNESIEKRVISELNWIEQNEKDLEIYLSFYRSKNEPSKYDKVLSFIDGKYLVKFRSRSPFKSSVKTKEQIIESSDKKKIRHIIYEIFNFIIIQIENNKKID